MRSMDGLTDASQVSVAVELTGTVVGVGPRVIRVWSETCNKAGLEKRSL